MSAELSAYEVFIEKEAAGIKEEFFDKDLKKVANEKLTIVEKLKEKDDVDESAWEKALEALKDADKAFMAMYNQNQSYTRAELPVESPEGAKKEGESNITSVVAPAPKPGEKISDVQKFYDEKYKTEPDGKYKSGYGSEKNAKGDTVLKFPDEKAATEFLEAFAKKEPNPTQLMVKVDEKGEPKGYAFIHGGKAFEGKNAQEIIDKINTAHAPNAEAAQSCLSAFKTSLEATPSRLRTETSCDDKLFKTTVNGPPIDPSMCPLSQAGKSPVVPNLDGDKSGVAAPSEAPAPAPSEGPKK